MREATYRDAFLSVLSLKLFLRRMEKFYITLAIIVRPRATSSFGGAWSIHVFAFYSVEFAIRTTCTATWIMGMFCIFFFKICYRVWTILCVFRNNLSAILSIKFLRSFNTHHHLTSLIVHLEGRRLHRRFCKGDKSDNFHVKYVVCVLYPLQDKAAFCCSFQQGLLTFSMVSGDRTLLLTSTLAILILDRRSNVNVAIYTVVPMLVVPASNTLWFLE